MALTRDEKLARRRAHHWANRERMNAASKAWYQKNGAGQSRRNYRELRARALAFLGGRCVQCGFDDARALQIDHVHGGGNKERKSFRGPAYINYNVLKGVGGP